jgi:succinoglycan biosynthesis transport protein ExoP
MHGGDGTLVEDDRLDLRAYGMVLRRRWKVVAITALVFVALALVLAWRQEPTYRAQAQLLIRQQTAEGIIEDVAASERALNDEVQILQSGTVHAAVRAVYEGDLDLTTVRASIASSTSNVIRITATAADPAEAANLVNLYANAYVDYRRAARVQDLVAIGTNLTEEIQAVEARIADARQPLDEIQARLDADPTNASLIAQRDQIADEVAAEVDSLNRALSIYQSRIEELSLSASIATASGARLLTAAVPPTSPVSPQPLRDATIALLLGLIAGVGLAFLFENLDERIRGVTDLEVITGGLPTLALVPEIERGHTPSFVAVRDDASGMQAEAFRSLRTAVKFAALDRPVKVIQVTSSAAGEGKTTTVANLAVALAQGGDRVAVVCCDLRRPRVQERFGVELTPGLTDVLVRDSTLSDALRRYDANTFVLPAGSPPPNPSELLSTNNAAAIIRALADEFDVVLVDSPPVLPVTDALVVSRFVDATIVVVNAKTARKAVGRTLQLLRQVNAPVLGTAFNGLPSGGQYGYGFGYGYGYGYGQGYAADAPEPSKGLAGIFGRSKVSTG